MRLCLRSSSGHTSLSVFRSRHVVWGFHWEGNSYLGLFRSFRRTGSCLKSLREDVLAADFLDNSPCGSLYLIKGEARKRRTANIERHVRLF